jgi:hypothetical protein
MLKKKMRYVKRILFSLVNEAMPAVLKNVEDPAMKFIDAAASGSSRRSVVTRQYFNIPSFQQTLQRH